EAASIGRVKPYHRASSLRFLSYSALLISPLARRRLSTSSAVARPSPPDVQSAIQTIMAAKPTKTSSAMIICMRTPDFGVLIGNLQSTRLRSGSLSQSWAGTLTQRHGGGKKIKNPKNE